VPNTLCFSRNRSVNVMKIDDKTMKSSCRIQDTLTDAFTQITVGLPDLEIVSAVGEFNRYLGNSFPQSDKALQKIKGVRIGSGMLKIINGLIGEHKELAFMIEECCHGIILSFTKDTLKDLPEDVNLRRDTFAGMVKENIRLYNRCAAFAPGSSIVKDIDAPQ
jgi:hypothetical protein